MPEQSRFRNCSVLCPDTHTYNPNDLFLKGVDSPFCGSNLRKYEGAPVYVLLLFLYILYATKMLGVASDKMLWALECSVSSFLRDVLIERLNKTLD